MPKFVRGAVLSLLVLCASGLGLAQSPYSVTIFNPTVMTATSQTSAAIVLGRKQGSIWTAGSYAGANVMLTGASLTTATFAVQGSSDGGVNYFPIPINAILTPTTTAATITATAAGIYQVSLAGLTHIRFVTSGTFTATNIVLTLTASPNANVSRSAGGGGGGQGTVTNTAGDLTAGNCVIGNGGNDEKVDPGCSTDGAGNMTLTGGLTTNGAANGYVNLTYSGTPATAPSTSTYQVSPLVNVTTPYVDSPAPAPVTGIWYGTASGSTLQRSVLVVPSCTNGRLGWDGTALTCSLTGVTLLGDVRFGAGGNSARIDCNSGCALQLGSPLIPVADANIPLGQSNLRYLSIALAPVAVGSLGSAATAGAGAQKIVSDSLTATPGTCVGGGSAYMIALSNGSTWSCR